MSLPTEVAKNCKWHKTCSHRCFWQIVKTKCEWVVRAWSIDWQFLRLGWL